LTKTLPEPFDLALRFFLVVSPVFYLPGQMAYVPQENFIQYSVMAFLALSWFVLPKRQISNVYIALILFYAMATTFLFKYTIPTRFALLNMFFGVLLIKIFAERVSMTNFKKIGCLFFIFILANLALMSLQVIDKDPIFSSVRPEFKPQAEVAGFMGVQYALGAIAALMLPFIFEFHPLACLILIPMFIAGKSSTAILAGVACFLFLLWFKPIGNRIALKFRGFEFNLELPKRLWFWIVLLVGAWGACYYVIYIDAPSGQFMKRLNVWWAGIYTLKMEPYFGYGLGQWAQKGFIGVQENGIPERWVWAHNEFLQYVFEQGVFGAILLYAFFKDFLRSFRFNDSAGRVIFASFIALMVVSIFHFPFHVGRLAGISLYIMALMFAYKAETQLSQTG